VPFLGLDIGEVDFEATMQKNLDDSVKAALDAEQLLPRSFATLPYGFGAMQAFRAWQRGGTRGMDPLWASPPRTMQRIMSELFGQNTPQDSGVDIAQPDVDDLMLSGNITLGAWGLYLALTKAGESDVTAHALTWRGDRLWIYTNDQDLTTYVLWQLELESEEAANYFDVFFRRVAAATHACAGSRAFVSYAVDSPTESAELTAWGKTWLAE